MPTASAAKQQLIDTLTRGVRVDFLPQAPADHSKAVRDSAVLILFGTLDRVTAETQTTETQAVSPSLDVLLTRRADGMRHHPGQIAFPGGGWEAEDVLPNGERSLEDTALREAAEETGLDPSGVEILGRLPEIYVPVSQNLVTPIVGWWSRPSTIRADDTESVQVFRVPVAELLDPHRRGLSVLRRPIGNTVQTFRAPAFQLHERFGGHIVWGFTGMLLSSLFIELGWAVPWSQAQEFPVQ